MSTDETITGYLFRLCFLIFYFKKQKISWRVSQVCHAETVKTLYALGCEIDIVGGPFDRSPLLHAVCCHNVNRTRYLLELNASLTPNVDNEGFDMFQTTMSELKQLFSEHAKKSVKLLSNCCFYIKIYFYK